MGVEVAAALLACLSVTGDASSHGGTIISVEGVSGSGTTVELICASNADMWMNGRRIVNQTPGAELVITQTMVPGRTYDVQTPGNGACGFNIGSVDPQERTRAVQNLLQQFAPGVPYTEVDLPSN